MYSEYLRNAVIEKRKMGKKLREISEEFHIEISTVQCLLNYKKRIHKKKTGPKLKINKKLSLQLKRYVAQQNNEGLKVNSSKIIRDNKLSVCRRTVGNWLNRNKYYYKKESQKIQLSNKHRTNRVSKISSWIHENIHWENAVFTDEKKFSLDGPDNWFE